MKKLHVAIVTLLGNGHVYSVLPLCSELVRRGHSVTYATSDHYARPISETGAYPVVFECPLPGPELIEKTQNIFQFTSDCIQFWDALRAFQKHQFSVVEKMLAGVKEFYDRNRPDLILYDTFNVGGRILARRLNCLPIRISAHFAQFTEFFFRENGVLKEPLGAHDYRRDIDSFLSAHGITTKNNYCYVEKLNIQLIPFEFQYSNDAFDNRFEFVGSLMNRRFLPSWKNGSHSRPIVLISDFSGVRETLINVNSYYKLFIDSLANSGLHCILSIGDNVDPNSLGSLPRHIEINQRSSHLEILKCASLLVCHGGMLSTLEALYNGVPVIAIPHTPGTEEVAYRVAELGLGKRILRSALSGHTIRQTVEETIGNTVLRARVGEMQTLFNRYRAAERAAELIETASEA